MKQKWIKEFEKSLITNPQFILWGNIYDIYPWQKEDGYISLLKLDIFLKEFLLQNHYDAILYYEPIGGLRVLEGDEERLKDAIEQKIEKDKPTKLSLTRFADLLEKIDQQKELAIATIFNYSSRLKDNFIPQVEVDEFFYKIYRILQNSTPKKFNTKDFAQYNIISFLVDKEEDFPLWYISENKKIKTIPIPKPDFFAREIAIKALFKRVKGYNEAPVEKQKLYESIFIDQTTDLFLYEIRSIILLALKEGAKYNEILEIINKYKLGIMENEWAKVSKEKLLKSKEILSKRVIGQENALNRATDILKRAYFNLSGSQFSKYSNKPKGVMFFVGPTGVGKTELAKAITQLIFGNENNYLRFDMSEFSAEHTTQRLLGAPPGYVGYESGGELINAVKKNPFSVLLFDEIEKAHPRIMDIFLQILDDGRITSAKGETIYFNETIIIFTSNLGVYEKDKNQPTINPQMDYETISKILLESIENYFKYRLQRPEILNRIGNNIVVFDFIRKENATKIFEKMLNNIIEKLEEDFNIKLLIPQTIKSIMMELALEDLSMGGRGIGNRLEDIFINPLSRALFEIDIEEKEVGIIKNFLKEGRRWKIELLKKSI